MGVREVFVEGLGGGHFCFIKIYSLVLNFDSLKDWKGGIFYSTIKHLTQ